jgi:hypothetical protein
VFLGQRGLQPHLDGSTEKLQLMATRKPLTKWNVNAKIISFLFFLSLLSPIRKTGECKKSFFVSGMVGN